MGLAELKERVLKADMSVDETRKELVIKMNESFFLKSEYEFELLKDKAKEKPLFVNVKGTIREIELLEVEKQTVNNAWDFPSVRVKVMNVKTKSEFSVFSSSIMCDLYGNGILANII